MRFLTPFRFSALMLGAAALALLAAADRASANDKLVVGKSFPTSFAFVPLNISVDAGIMSKNGLDVTIQGFEGTAKLQQAMTAGQVDIGLGSGTDMAFVAKGVPEKAVAAMAGPPLAWPTGWPPMPSAGSPIPGQRRASSP
jgi:NitT/TauT family transport system substrate-binding protein